MRESRELIDTIELINNERSHPFRAGKGLDSVVFHP